jgi:hypothetical protein
VPLPVSALFALEEAQKLFADIVSGHNPPQADAVIVCCVTEISLWQTARESRNAMKQ